MAAYKLNLHRGGCSGDVLENPNLVTNIHRDYVDGKAMSSGVMKQFIEDECEWNPDEILEEQADNGTFAQTMSTLLRSSAGRL
jgi:hypothetical protein